MKKSFSIILLALGCTSFAQDSIPIKHAETNWRPDTLVATRQDSVRYMTPIATNWPFQRKSVNDNRNDSIKIFSLSPISRHVKEVNGFTLGFGHYENSKIRFQRINGLNLEASPLSLALVTFSINVPFEGLFVGINDNSISNMAFFYDSQATFVEINGLNLSSGGFMGGAKVNGINICVFSKMNQMNGLSITGGLLGVQRFNGLSIAGIANLAEYGAGLQIGVSNVSRTHRGVQIGLFNHSKNLKGFQFGLWNTNGKRKLPLMNWQF